MKNIILSVVTVLALAWFLLPIPLPGQGGVYNPTSGLLWCSHHAACVHEVGHKLDDNGGWISHKQEFSTAVYLFVGSELIANDKGSSSYKLSHKILRTPGVIWGSRWLDTQSEIYATIFSYSDGKQENMPPVFRQFYNWDEAGRLLQRYQKYPGEIQE